LYALVRIHVPLNVYDAKTGVARHAESRIWDYILENHNRWRTKAVKLLYMTHRHLQEDTSLIVKAKDPDALAEFLMRHIAQIKDVRGIWVLNMAGMRFFMLPKTRPGDFSRFTVTIDAIPKHMGEIYERISALEPGRDIMVTYIAHTFQSFKSSIMVSVLARSRNHVEIFVKDYICPLEGVLDTEVTYISKTMRLVSLEEWQRSVGKFVVGPGKERIRDIDAEDESLMAGC